MSYKKWKESARPSAGGTFLKAQHLKSGQIALALKGVEERELPNSGKTLVCSFALDADVRKQLTKEYLDALKDAGRDAIDFPLNNTNSDRLAAMFGDDLKAWHGTVTLMIDTARNPKTKQMIETLRILLPAGILRK